MDENQYQQNPDGSEARMLFLLQRMQQLELGKMPNRGLEITMAQMQLIRYVGENPGCHLQDVAEGLGLSSPTVSVSIRRLEDLKLISRESDPDDGRANCLFLTRKSMKAFKQVTQQMFERMKIFLSQLTKEEQKQLIKLMEKAVSGIELKAQQAK